MRAETRATILLHAAVLSSLGPAAARLYATERDPAAMVPRSSLVYAGWSNPHSGWGLDVIDTEGLAGLLELLMSESDEVQREQAADAVGLIVTALKAEGALALLEPVPGATAPRPVLALRLGSTANDFQQRCLRIVPLREDPGGATLSVGGRPFTRIRAGAPGLDLLMGVHDGVLIVADGVPAAENVIACLEGKGESLASHPEFQACHQRIGSESSCVTLFCSAAALMDRLIKPMLSPQQGVEPEDFERVVEALGVRGLRSAMWQGGSKPDAPWTRSFLRIEGPRKGILKLWDQAPLSEDDLRLVPADAYWAVVQNCDLSALWAETMSVIGTVQPEAVPQVEGALALAAAMIGFSIPDNLLPALGDTWVLFDAPRHGGIYLTGTVLVAEARDPEGLHGMLARTVEMLAPLAAQKNVHLLMKEMQHGEHRVHYVLIGGVPCPVAPAWAFAHGRWVFGLLPQTVAEALDQVDAKTRKGSILDRPEVKEALAGRLKSAQCFSCWDVHYMMHSVYPFLTHAVAAVAAMNPSSDAVDLARLPHFSKVLAGPRFGVSVGSATEDGIIYEGRGFSLLPANAGVVALVTSILLPSLSRARELAKRAVCKSNLRGIGQGMHIYAHDHENRLPARLGELVEAGLSITGQFVCPSSSQTEDEVAAILAGKEPGLLGYRYIDGQSADADVRNVLVYEDLANHNGEGGNVLFFDGHVEFLKPPRYQEVIRDTYKRLGREAQMPAEFRE